MQQPLWKNVQDTREYADILDSERSSNFVRFVEKVEQIRLLETVDGDPFVHSERNNKRLGRARKRVKRILNSRARVCLGHRARGAKGYKKKIRMQLTLFAFPSRHRPHGDRYYHVLTCQRRIGDNSIIVYEVREITYALHSSCIRRMGSANSATNLRKQIKSRAHLALRTYKDT